VSLSLCFCPQLLTSTRKYYDLLEVSPNASEADLKKAYRKKFSILQLFFPIVSLIVFQSSQITSRQGWRPRAIQRSNPCVRSTSLVSPSPLTYKSPSATKSYRIQTNAVYMTQEGRLVYQNKAVWVAWMPKYALYFLATPHSLLIFPGSL
jgi:hypothetical protein